MGSAFSSDSNGARDASNVLSERETMDEGVSVSREGEITDEFHDTIDDTEEQEARARARAEEMEKFNKQLNIKREQRREILNRHKTEKQELEKSLENEKKARLEALEMNRMLRELLRKNNINIPEVLQDKKEMSHLSESIANMKEEFEKFKSNNNRLRRELAESHRALQGAYSDIAELQAQNTESIKHINALKEVVSVSKTMINLRENQLNELKNKLTDIERSLADREASMLSTDLRKEYERQLQNIRTLRSLYEERARLAEVTRTGLVRELEEQKLIALAEIKKSKELTNKVEELEAKVDELQECIENKNSQISTNQNETSGLKAEMSAINKLFSQVLLGYKTKQDLDKLIHRLEENHGLLTHMAERENGSEASMALPKLLLELVSQIDDDDGEEIKNSETPNSELFVHPNTEVSESQIPSSTSAEEIVQNLPKVWRVLMELLSHQSTSEECSGEKVTTCYKSVETKSGPVLVPSVSQTYIRLKDLIVEKLSLVKEVNRMKQLNVHLESRLEEQERRLCLVTTELSKTWHVVGRLRRHHHQLHTHEKILKYELQQKRKLLNELKEELEYCREKWEQAREKNTQSEKDWRKLRTEFSSRKSKSSSTFNNSAESGYSDERPSDESSESNDESEYVAEPLVRCMKTFKKSFETVVDSSTDFNLAAEREDPASDMLDVADLPLDTQEGDNDHDVSDSCNSASCPKSEKLSEETEDEIGDITNEELSTTESGSNTMDKTNLSTVNGSEKKMNLPQIDPAAILKSIQEQNERLAKKDKKLEKLEKSSSALLKQTQITSKVSEHLNSALDHLINRPSSSKQNNEANLTVMSSLDAKEQATHSGEVQQNVRSSESILTNETLNSAAIHKNIQEQNESQAKRDQKVENQEMCCVSLLDQTQILPKDCEQINSPLDNDMINTSSPSKQNEEVEKLLSTTQPNLETNQDAFTESSLQDLHHIDPAAILKNIQEQNERLAKKDKKLEKLERSGAALLKQTQTTVKISEQINDTLDHLLNRPRSSKDSADKQSPQTEEETKTNTEATEPIKNKQNHDDITMTECDTDSQANSVDSVVNLKAILENVIQHDKRLKKRDERLQTLEEGCSGLNSTLDVEENILEKNDTLHDEQKKDDSSSDLRLKGKTEDLKAEEDTLSSGRNSSEPPSTSSEMDHEARFAARDLRLKRLEEQTKSLVHKVNDTNTKRVKLSYKLEELHNIYGSENSRDGTPSDDHDDKQGNEENTEED